MVSDFSIISTAFAGKRLEGEEGFDGVFVDELHFV